MFGGPPMFGTGESAISWSKPERQEFLERFDGLQLLAVHEGANLRDIFANYQRPKAEVKN